MKQLGYFFALITLTLAAEVRGAVLSATFSGRDAGTSVDLTSGGAVDWVHWGFDSTNITRKAVSPLISDSTFIGTNIPVQVTNVVAFSWSDGTPTNFATNVLTSAGITGETNGFAVTIPVSTSISKVLVYAGAFAAEGRLEAELNDGVTPIYSVSSLTSIDATNGVYLIDVIAEHNNDLLTIRFTANTLLDVNGYVTLQAIAVTTNAAPVVSLITPTNEQNVVLGAETTVTASAFDSDGSITNVEFFVDELKIGEATNAPFSFAWIASALGPHTVTAVATDNYGAQSTAAPVTIFVTGTNGIVQTSLAVAPATVNLTTEGTSDWVHWGLYTETSVDRKSAVVPQIGDFSVIGWDVYSYGDNATSYSWTDGQPNASVSGTPTGVYVVGRTNGFQLTAPADQNPRTLKIYLGTYGARGKFTATLSDYSAPVYIDRSVDNEENGPASVYTLNYAAGSDAQTLTLTFTCDEMHDIQYGNVTLQAATLVSTANPLYLSLAAPTNNTIVSAPANIQLQASLTGGNGSPRTVEFMCGTTKIGEATSPPYTVNWSAVPVGAYDVIARITNSLGKYQSSAPVRIYVVGTGGTMLGMFSPTSGSVNLTAEGTKEWAHWGLLRKNSFNRKLNSQQITTFSSIGEGHVDQYADNLVSYNWTDGTPTLSVGGTTTGVFIDKLGSGFQLTLPADKTLRRLKLYVGLFAARGQFEATLSDLSAAPYIHSSFENTYNNATGVYTVEYAAASPGQTLTIRYTSSLLFDPDYGNVTLQAATLRQLSPTLAPVFNANSSTVNVGFNTESGWNYFVDYTDSLNPAVWIPLTSFAGNGSFMTIPDATGGSTNRFYRARMSK